MTDQKPKIFLSYAHEDIGMAKRIYQDLKRYGLDVWFDNESLLPGQDWENEIEKAIETSKYFLVLPSSKGMSERGYVHKEIRLALNFFDKCPEDDIYMIPVRLDDCQPAHRRIKKINWINLFPESEYQNGLKKILQVVSPGTFIIRNKPKELSSADVNEMIKMHGYYDSDRNPVGKGIGYKYKLKEINGKFVVFDEITNLIWEQSGLSNAMFFKDVEKCIYKLNETNYAGYKDWRLLTLEKAMSLVKPERKNNLYIDSIFNNNQRFIWTADKVKEDFASWEWVVLFSTGSCSNLLLIYSGYYVRAVRSG